MTFRCILLVVSILVGNVVARNGCRQCTGAYRLVFDTYVTECEARDYLEKQLSGCATGGQYEVTGIRVGVCTQTTEITCRSWDFDLKVFRYCGNGPTVIRTKKWMCATGYCFYGEHLKLQCTKSVDCASKCECVECAC